MYGNALITGVWKYLQLRPSSQQHATHTLPLHPQAQVHGNALIMGEWKYLQLGAGHSPADEAGWHPPPGQVVYWW